MALKKYGLVVSGDEKYGVGSPLESIACGLDKQGIDSVVITLNDGSFSHRLTKQGIATISLGLPKAPPLSSRFQDSLQSIANLRAWRKKAMAPLQEAIDEYKIDSLTFRWPTHIVLAGIANKHNGMPCFWMMPNIIRSGFMGINRRIYQRFCLSNRITPLPNSHYTAKTLDLNHKVVASKVLYLGIDSDKRFNPKVVENISRESLSIPEGATLFGIFSMITPRKGQHFFLKALQQTEGIREAHLLLVGASEGEFAKYIKQLAENYGCYDRVHFTGWTDCPEKYYSIVDVAVNSRIDPEPFGLSVIEAMAMQKPVLVHALGGPAETVIDGVTGWHVHEPTLKGYGQGIVRCLADRLRWKEMGDAARQHVLENFSLEAFTQNFIKVTN